MQQTTLKRQLQNLTCAFKSIRGQVGTIGDDDIKTWHENYLKSSESIVLLEKSQDLHYDDLDC
jgi:hypothetical protein